MKLENGEGAWVTSRIWLGTWNYMRCKNGGVLAVVRGQVQMNSWNLGMADSGKNPGKQNGQSRRGPKATFLRCGGAEEAMPSENRCSSAVPSEP